MKRDFAAILLIVLQSVLYGLGDPISKTAFETVPLFVLLTMRYGIALLVMMLFWGRRIIKGIKEASWKDWLLPTLCMGGAYVFNNIGLLLTHATAVAFIRSLPTIIAPILAFVFLKRKYRRVLIPIQAAVVIGLYMLCCGRGGLGGGFGLGELFALLSAILLAASLVFGERSLERVEPITLTALMTAASLLMAIKLWFVSDQKLPQTIPTKSWIIILYLAVLCTIAGYLLQNIALKSIKAHTVAVVQCLCPVMTAVFSFIILGERLSAFGICGTMIIIVCLVLAVVLDKKEDAIDELK